MFRLSPGILKLLIHLNSLLFYTIGWGIYCYGLNVPKLKQVLIEVNAIKKNS